MTDRIRTALLLLPVLCFAQQAQPGASGPPDGSVKVSISKFKKLDGPDRLGALETGLPGALRLALLQYHWMDVSLDLGTRSLFAALVDQSPASSTAKDVAKAEYTIEGSFTGMQSKIRLSVSLKRVSDGAIVYADFIGPTEDSLLSGIESLSSRIGERLRARAAPARRLLTIVVGSPFQIASPAPNISVPSSLTRFIPDTISAILTQSKIENVTFRLGDSATSDATVSGALSADGGRLVLTTTINEGKSHLVTFSTSAMKDRVTALPEQAARQIEDIVRARVTPEGEWRKEGVSLTAASSDDYLLFARSYRGARLDPEAILMYRKALEAKPGLMEAQYALADIYRMEGDDLAAAAEFDEILRLNPRDYAAEQGLAEIAVRIKDYPGAIQHYSTALTLAPVLDPNNRATLQASLGDVYWLAGRQDEALASYRKAIDADPKDPAPYRLISRAEIAGGNTRGALDWLNQGLSRFPGDPSLKTALAEIYKQAGVNSANRGEYTAALGYFEKMRSAGASAETIGFDGYDAMQKSFHATNQDQEAARVFRGELNRNPGNTSVLSLLALIYHDYLWDFEKGYEINQTEYAKSPTDPYVLGNLAESCLATQRFDRVLTLANQVMANPLVSTEHRLTMRFLTISALLFQGKAADAYPQVGEFIGYYNSLPADYDRTWTFTGTRRFVTQQNKIAASDKQIILNLIDVLETPKGDAAKKIASLAAMLPSRFEQHTAQPGDK